MLYVVDLSQWQTLSATQWDDIASKCAGVILRYGYRGYGSGKIVRDSKLDAHLAAARQRGLALGLYFFTQALTPLEARAEVDAMAAAVDLAQYPLGIWCDTELANGGAGRADKISCAQRTDACNAWVARAQEHGARAGIYASTSWLFSKLDTARIHCPIWVADYRQTCGWTGDRVLWQYSSSNALNIIGCGTHLDCNRLYDEGWLRLPSAVRGPMPDLGGTTLRKGARGTAVRHLQEILNTLGFPCGSVDGIYGARTRTAVRNFQRAHGLGVDGVVGKATKAALSTAWGA